MGASTQIHQPVSRFGAAQESFLEQLRKQCDVKSEGDPNAVFVVIPRPADVYNKPPAPRSSTVRLTLRGEDIVARQNRYTDQPVTPRSGSYAYYTYMLE